MTLKTFFLFLLCATLVLADVESDHIQISKLRDEQMIHSYFLTKDPLSMKLLWDQVWARYWYIYSIGRRVALEQADISDIEAVKNEWVLLYDQIDSQQLEIKLVIDSFRTQAMAKAPREWTQAALKWSKLFEDFKRASAEGSANNMRKIVNEYINYYRNLAATLIRTIESRP